MNISSLLKGVMIVALAYFYFTGNLIGVNYIGFILVIVTLIEIHTTLKNK